MQGWLYSPLRTRLTDHGVDRLATHASIAALALALLASTSAHAGDGTRELPPQAREFVEQAAKGLMTVQDPDAELSCEKAVDNATYGLDTMLEVGQRNMEDGYMKRADYDAASTRLRAFRAAISVDDCRSASGPQREFYRCMSSDYNHVFACAVQLRG